MSWLLDRLTGLAVADRLTIVIDASADPMRQLAPTLDRASTLEGTTVMAKVKEAGPPPPTRGELRLVVAASDGTEGWFSSLRTDDLGVSVGAAAPGADVRVDELRDAATVLDTLVTLRAHALRAIA